VTDAELTGTVGLPYFLTGCIVAADLTSLAAGRRTELSLQAQVSISANHPGLHRITRLPLADLRDETSDRSSPFGRIVCIPTPGTPPEQLREMLLDVTGVCTKMPVALPRPMPALIRRWVQTNASEDLLASLAALEHAIPSQKS
jgi:hypothetical protein